VTHLIEAYLGCHAVSEGHVAAAQAYRERPRAALLQNFDINLLSCASSSFLDSQSCDGSASKASCVIMPAHSASMFELHIITVRQYMYV
jgi:hypothetical protein